MRAHFVTFLSPGSLIAGQITKPIDSWNVDAAISLSSGIRELHGARPYAFYFNTRGREDGELDSKEINRSPTYFLGGKVETLEDVRNRNDPKDRILLSNMTYNGYDRIITTTSGWAWTQPLRKDDIVLDTPIHAYKRTQ